MLWRLKNKIGYLSLGALALLAFFIWSAVFAQTPKGEVLIDFFDVGQGSAVLINAPNDNQALIDGGPSDAILAKLGEALSPFDRRIEILILTHPDADHLSGLIEVLKRYQVGEILETGIADSSVAYQEWQALIEQKKIPVVFAHFGQTVKIADNLSISILYPFGEISGRDFGDNTNSTSIIAKLNYGENSFLFTGDAEGSVEAPLLGSNLNLQADILQVAHHGSKNATGEEFLSVVAPKEAVIQVGAKNPYGHPTQEVLARLKDKNINTWRTDLSGDIEFMCNLQQCAKK
jgi:competence protein ComEC